MSDPFRPRQRLRMRSRASGFDSGSSLSSLSSLGVVEYAVALDSQCTLEGCECKHCLAELAKSYEILSHEAFTFGELTITPIRPL